jgi:hypothetical protein
MSAPPDEIVRQPTAARRPSRRTLALIIALGIVALLAVGWLADVLASLPRGVATSSLTPQTAHAGLDTVTLRVSPTPLLAGRDEALLLQVTDVSGQPVVGAHIVCALNMAEMATTAPSINALPGPQSGAYSCAARLPHRGMWTVRVEVAPETGQPALAVFTVNAG